MTRATSPGRDDAAVDPKVVEAVQMVRDRFGAHGLRDMLRLGQTALTETESALAQLREEQLRDEAAGA